MTSEPSADSFLSELEGSLKRYACAVGLSNHDAEDVVQESMVRFTNAQEKGKEIRNPKAYIYSIVRNCSITRLRFLSKQNEVEMAEDHPQEEREDSVYSDPTLREAYRAALSELEPADRALVRKRYMDGMTLRAMAEQLGCTPQNVYKRLKKIVSRTLSDGVQSALQEVNPELADELFNTKSTGGTTSNEL